MKTQDELDKLIEKSMKASSMESPSAEFSSMVISRIENLSLSQAIIYKPLISKPVWIIIACSIIIYYIYLVMQLSPTRFMDFFNYKFNLSFTNKIFNVFSAIGFSTITFYAILFSLIMLLIQIPFLKYYFNKRIVL